MFVNEYEYFIFTEDDVYVFGEHYVDRAITRFNDVLGCGFLSFQGLSSSSFDLRGPSVLHARGGVGMTSADVLRSVLTKHDNFPYHRGGGRNFYLQIIREGEVAFTNVIYREGFVLAELDHPNRIVFYDYDMRRGVIVPFKPGVLSLFIYYVKVHSMRIGYRLLLLLGLLPAYRSFKSKFLNMTLGSAK
jgi:hypothetical protein